MDVEIAYHRMLRDDLREHHPELSEDADAALAAVVGYGEWLEKNQSTMTAPAGVAFRKGWLPRE